MHVFNMLYKGKQNMFFNVFYLQIDVLASMAQPYATCNKHWPK